MGKPRSIGDRPGSFFSAFTGIPHGIRARITIATESGKIKFGSGNSGKNVCDLGYLTPRLSGTGIK